MGLLVIVTNSSINRYHQLQNHNHLNLYLSPIECYQYIYIYISIIFNYFLNSGISNKFLHLNKNDISGFDLTQICRYKILNQLQLTLKIIHFYTNLHHRKLSKTKHILRNLSSLFTKLFFFFKIILQSWISYKQ